MATGPIDKALACPAKIDQILSDPLTWPRPMIGVDKPFNCKRVCCAHSLLPVTSEYDQESSEWYVLQIFSSLQFTDTGIIKHTSVPWPQLPWKIPNQGWWKVKPCMHALYMQSWQCTMFSNNHVASFLWIMWCDLPYNSMTDCLIGAMDLGHHRFKICRHVCNTICYWWISCLADAN